MTGEVSKYLKSVKLTNTQNVHVFLKNKYI